MTNLVFSTGTYKEYQLNGKETIRICVTDPGIIDRVKSLPKKIEEIEKKYGDTITEENLEPLDKVIRQLIDETINCPGASDKAFGAINCLGISGGKPVYVNFLSVLLDQLSTDIAAVSNAERIKLDENIELNNERTQRYITQSKPTAQPSDTVNALNLAVMSKEERYKMLDKILGVDQQ